MAFIVSGINHKTAPVQIREKLSFTEDSAIEAIRKFIATGTLKEAVLLSTCNRTEIYGVLDDTTHLNGHIPRLFADLKEIEAEDIAHYFYQKTERDAILHLFRVVSGLDSMVVGETQILGQVKQAYLWASQAGTTDTYLNKLFHHAFRTGKRVRTETRIGEGSVSVGSVAADLAKKIFKNFADKTVAIVGAGEMAVQTLQHLRDAGADQLMVINRTLEKARQLAELVQGTVIPYEELEQGLLQADTVIASTGAKEPIIGEAMIREIMSKRNNRPLFLIDIAVPRNIDPSVRDIYNVYLYDIDDLQNVISHNLEQRQKEIPKALNIVEEEADEFLKWFETIPAIELIQQLQKHFETIRQAEVKRYRKYFSKEDWDQVDKFSRSLLKKFLHSPIVRLRTCPESKDLCTKCTVKELFGLEVECQVNE